MQLESLLACFEAIAPLRHAEAWDNVGLLVGSREDTREHTGVLLCIDATEAVLEEALAAECTVVWAYHPLVFEGLKRIVGPSPIYTALRHGLTVYSPHTALDVAPGGTNDTLAEALGLRELSPLKPTTARLSAESPEAGWGLGRKGVLASPTPLRELLARTKAQLSLEHVLVAGSLDRHVTRAAVCAGAGRGLLDEALRAGAELLLTGELPHHDALRAVSRGMTVFSVLHSNSERTTLPRVAARLRASAPGLRVQVSVLDHDPFAVH